MAQILATVCNELRDDWTFFFTARGICLQQFRWRCHKPVQHIVHAPNRNACVYRPEGFGDYLLRRPPISDLNIPALVGGAWYVFPFILRRTHCSRFDTFPLVVGVHCISFIRPPIACDSNVPLLLGRGISFLRPPIARDLGIHTPSSRA